MHYKIAYFLVHEFDKVYLGKFNIMGIFSPKNKTIPQKVKDSLRVLSPGKFWTILEHMGYKYATKTERVSEFLTTKTCSTCGNTKDVGDSKEYMCTNCGMETGRDENSAKNHLKLGLESEKPPREESFQNKKSVKKAPKKKMPKKPSKRKSLKKLIRKRVHTAEIVEV